MLGPPPARRPTARRRHLHVHTDRSDGTGTADEIAAAAARAGLQFVVLTDHGDGTRPPDPPTYRARRARASTPSRSAPRAGHFVALGLAAAPYPLAGEARDVIEDVTGSAASPSSRTRIRRNPNLRWRDWDAPFDAIEWLNADTEWRDEHAPRLARALTVSISVRGDACVASRSPGRRSRWDTLTQRRLRVAHRGRCPRTRRMDGRRRERLPPAMVSEGAFL